MSDLHLGPLPDVELRQLVGKRAIGYVNWRQRREQEHSRHVLDRLVADLKQQAHDHIAITGDLVNLALPKEFEAAQEWLEALGAAGDVSVVPGNHDAYVRPREDLGLMRWAAWMRGNEAGAEYKRQAVASVSSNGGALSSDAAFPYVRLFGKVAIIGLCAAMPTPWFVCAGKLGDRQLGEMRDMLQRLGEDGCFRLLLIHHPPVRLPGLHQARCGLHDVEAFTDIVAGTGVELILHGHHHTNARHSISTSSGTAPIIGVPSASVIRHHKRPLARYNLYRIWREDAGWRCHLTGRGLGSHGGDIVEQESTLIITGAGA